VSDDSLERALTLTDFLKRALRHLFDEEFAFTKDCRTVNASYGPWCADQVSPTAIYCGHRPY
jgi:hypothetical protein